MKFKLFYKEYPCSMTLRAMKEFKETTGKDLWSTLLEYIRVYSESRSNNEALIITFKKLAEICDTIEAAQILYIMAKQENGRLTLDEIEDGVFHSGWLPSKEEGDFAEPYQLVLFQLALDIDAYMSELISKKKP